jgi:hypothetical protein
MLFPQPPQRHMGEIEPAQKPTASMARGRRSLRGLSTRATDGGPAPRAWCAADGRPRCALYAHGGARRIEARKARAKRAGARAGHRWSARGTGAGGDAGFWCVRSHLVHMRCMEERRRRRPERDLDAGASGLGAYVRWTGAGHGLDTSGCVAAAGGGCPCASAAWPWTRARGPTGGECVRLGRRQALGPWSAHGTAPAAGGARPKQLGWVLAHGAGTS